ncbi:MAG: sulfite exporter TauE/SafE family protein [Bacillaceae bacterium]
MHDILFIMGFGFIAAFVDAIAGGGGLISVPALLFTGMPPQLALGTNKLGSTMGSFVSSMTYLRSSHADKKLLKKLIPFTVVGAIIGVFVLRLIPPDKLKPLIIFLLIGITVYTLVKKRAKDGDGHVVLTTGKFLFLITMACVIGFYDGFFGPGTGSFLIFSFTLVGMTFLQAGANAKILNFTSNLVSAITFVGLGMVDYKLGIAMGIGMIPGAYIGSHFAIKQGSRLVKPMFIVITVFLIGKQLFFS